MRTERHQFTTQAEVEKLPKCEEHVDALADYLNSIAAYKLLDSEQERRLGFDILIAQGAYEWLKDISDSLDNPVSSTPPYVATINNVVEDYATSSMLNRPPEDKPNQVYGTSPNTSVNGKKQIPAHTPKSEEIACAIDFLKRGEKSYECLVNSNLRLVVSVAKKYHFDVPLIDLVQMGNLGLLKAAAKFNPALGYKFSTYAVWWIRQSIEREVQNTASFIREPVHFVSLRKRAQKIKNTHLAEAGNTLTNKQLAELLGVPVESIDAIDKLSTHEPLSLSYPISTDEDSNWEAIIPNDEVSVEDQVEQTLTGHKLSSVMEYCLTDRERTALSLRFGLKDGQSRTLDQVGILFGVTRERIRQIEARALRKLRNHLIHSQKQNGVPRNIDNF